MIIIITIIAFMIAYDYCQALVLNPSPKSPQAQPLLSPTQFQPQLNPKGTGADTKIL